MFLNRTDAGKLLAERLGETLARPPYDDGANIVVGLPRGGVPVAAQVSRAIGAPLTVLVAKKIGAPWEPEFALGAVSSTGVVVLNEQIPMTGVLHQYVRQESKRLQSESENRERRFLEAAGIQPLDYTGKQVIIVDDGIATGMTAFAALSSAKAKGAKRIILAVPVAEGSTFEKLSQACDLVVSLLIPAEFVAVGQFYQDFSQVSDDEVIRALVEGSECLR